MKKMLHVFLLVTSILIAGENAFAANGDVAGYIYSTDIIAYINDKPIESYSVG